MIKDKYSPKISKEFAIDLINASLELQLFPVTKSYFCWFRFRNGGSYNVFFSPSSWEFSIYLSPRFDLISNNFLYSLDWKESINIIKKYNKKYPRKNRIKQLKEILK